MNRKQRVILGITILFFAPPIIGWLLAAIQFRNFAFFFDKILELLPLIILIAPVAGGLLYVFRDKKPKK